MSRGMDHELLTSEISFFDPITEDQCHLARLQVCANALDIEDAIDLMKMLGIYPGQEGEEMAMATVYPLFGGGGI